MATWVKEITYRELFTNNLGNVLRFRIFRKLSVLYRDQCLSTGGPQESFLVSVDILIHAQIINQNYIRVNHKTIQTFKKKYFTQLKARERH